ncbi:hypothetical protein GYMLUDRAFT_45621 [Collybiopsis luxurians FD-317 M1]|uniref:Autophagy-related protein 13 n=1 Tax=Collybiopsis luxurians FD-317 M1 TaxID=944289 RepID=A0A0D0CRA1_9AGAR|nr:hypothetical protein GYMLUDRAFT_45621 [Collybiopsis luxurians FD-317 M1]
MSHDAQQKITFHFYTKLFYVVNDARTSAALETGKTDKWFNLETPDSELWTREGRDPYRSISDPRSLPPLEIQVLLTIPETLASNQVLVYIAPDSSRTPIESTYKYVLLERWVLELNTRDSSVPSSSSESDFEASSGSMALSTVYKHGIPMFRSLYSLLRVLPAWKLSKRFRTRRNGTGGLGIQVRVKGDPGSGVDRSTVMHFGSPLALPTSTHVFPPIQHPLGNLILTSTYLSSPNFRIDERESLLSSRFMSMDTGTKEMEFTPTLVKNQQRDSMLSSAGGSLGTRSSLPRSPPREIPRRTSPPPRSHTQSHSRAPSDADSIAERFIIPSRTASTSNPTPPLRQTSIGHPILPITRATTTSSPSSQPSPGLAARLRRESLGSTVAAAASDSYLPSTTGIGTSTSTQPLPFPSYVSSTPPIPGIPGTSAPTSTSASSSPISPMAVRRPGLNPINPFKSNTLTGVAASSAGSSRVSSALGTRLLPGSSPSRAGGIPESSLALGGTSSSNTGLGSLSSLSNLSNLPAPTAGPLPLGKPSPPPHVHSFAPSSLGAASAGTGTSASSGSVSNSAAATVGAAAATDEIAIPFRRKRYSSSFGHRYSSPARGGASVGSSVGGGGSQGGGSTEGGILVGSSRSGGSGSAGGGRESRRVSTITRPSSPLQDIPGLPQDDHDDISLFMQDIDTRKPLIGRSRIYAQAQQGEIEGGDAPITREDLLMGRARHRLSADAAFSSPSSLAAPVSTPPSPRRRSDAGVSPPSSPLRNVIPLADEDEDEGESSTNVHTMKPLAAIPPPPAPSQPSTTTTTATTTTAHRRSSSSSSLAKAALSSSPPTHSSPMLTTAPDVEARLKKMNDAFMASLQGLGSGSSTVRRHQRGGSRDNSYSTLRAPSSGSVAGSGRGADRSDNGSGAGTGDGEG